MEEKNIITLNNGDRYFILNNIKFNDNEIYFFGLRIDNENNLIDNSSSFFKIIENRFEKKVIKIKSSDDIFQKLIITELLEASVGVVPGVKKQIKDFILQKESSI